MDVDMDSARRRIAPLLHALVQATDFSIRITPESIATAEKLRGKLGGGRFDLRIDVLGELGQQVGSPSKVYWNRVAFLAVNGSLSES